MNPLPIRLLFRSHNRRGLGHLMRGLNLAREIRRLAPSSEILFYTRSDSAELLCGQDFRYFIETDLQGTAHWPEVVRSFSPDVVIYDTLLPQDATQEALLPSAQYVYIMRKCQEARQQEIFQSAFLDRLDLILIPHTPEEFAHELPPSLAQRSFFVGPIVRMPRPEIQDRLREKYGIEERDFLLTSTVGGGGFEAQAESFFATVFAVHRRLYPALPHLRHLVIQGPNFGRSLSALDGMTVIAYEPEMIDLFVLSNLVIAEGGYNTVNEIRLAKAPAVFLPSPRNYDDQEERVRALEERGLAWVFAGCSPEKISQKVVELCSSESGLSEIKKRYAMDRMETGNRAAAEKIVGVVVR
ncbi:MAG: hypothetical protein HYY20_00260 [Candidatus Tectomicrobia bacterium]|uniref:Glycosyl transferase family 28 C-terminal domain-containing protein n=1 Tax=Tectimicrobiota bacterium TaxID=2528274 RepID=A0A932CKY9_UNCTE|nr:hypothetical protein [Candidatus Tectomicrobia bacterium]